MNKIQEEQQNIVNTYIESIKIAKEIKEKTGHDASAEWLAEQFLTAERRQSDWIEHVKDTMITSEDLAAIRKAIGVASSVNEDIHAVLRNFAHTYNARGFR